MTEEGAGDDAPQDGPKLPVVPTAPPGPAAEDARRLQAERHMLESLVCPVTQGRLEWHRDAKELVSRKARLAFPVRDGIPIMITSEARDLD